MKKSFFLVFLILFNVILLAEITLDSYVDKTKVGKNEIVRFSLEFSGENAGNIRTPSVKNINGFRNMGSSSSSSSNIVVSNGKMERTVTKTFTYNLKALKTGSLLIPPLSIEVDKQKFTTKPIRIQVTEKKQENVPNNNRLTTDNNISTNFEDNLFLLCEVSKSSLYKDEPVIVKYLLYSRYDISNLQFANEPNFNGFWKENISTADRMNFKRTTYQDQSINVMEMRQVALFPSKTGTLDIPSLQVLVDIRTKPTSFFDFGSTKRYNIKSKPVKINVKELPVENKPSDFSGAVGIFNIKSSISESDLKVGESFTYTLEISGSGNLNHFDPPYLPEIQNLRFIDPEISTDINSNRINGKKVIKYLVIAQEKGVFTIPSLSFSYFDTKNKRYVTRKTQPHSLNISESDQSLIPSSSAQSLVTREGSDIGFIIRETDLAVTQLHFSSFLYWFILFLGILALPVFSAYYGKREKLYSDQDYIRQKQADKILKKYLKKATDKFKIGDEGFYTDVQTGLSNYLTDKLRINRGSSTSVIINELKDKVPQELLDRITAIFSKCDEVRFMPGGFSETGIKNDYELLRSTISSLTRIKF